MQPSQGPGRSLPELLAEKAKTLLLQDWWYECYSENGVSGSLRECETPWVPDLGPGPFMTNSFESCHSWTERCRLGLCISEPQPIGWASKYTSVPAPSCSWVTKPSSRVMEEETRKTSCGVYIGKHSRFSKPTPVRWESCAHQSMRAVWTTGLEELCLHSTLWISSLGQMTPKTETKEKHWPSLGGKRSVEDRSTLNKSLPRLLYPRN